MNITISNLDHSYVLELNEDKLEVDEWQNGMAALTSGSDENVYQAPKLNDIISRGLFSRRRLFVGGERAGKVKDFIASLHQYDDGSLRF